MVEPGEDPDLAEEPLVTEGGSELRTQDLDGDLGPTGQASARYTLAAMGELAEEPVTVAEMGLEGVEEVVDHGWKIGCWCDQEL